jgi:hypothetical protein
MAWSPVTYEPVLASASVRLAFLRKFGHYVERVKDRKDERIGLILKAKDWSSSEEEQPPTTYANICTELNVRFSKSFEVPHLSRLWNNPYAVQTTNPPIRPVGRAIMTLSKAVFSEDESPEVTGAISGIQEVTQETKRQTNPISRADEVSTLLTERYGFIIDRLRDIEKKTLSLLRIISYYDEWIVQLAEYASVGAKEKYNTTLQHAAEKAAHSSGELREAQRLHFEQHPSPITKYLYYVRLTNELQMYCIAAYSADSDRSGLLETIKKIAKETDYFALARRFNEICDWRVEEMQHALIVGSCIGHAADEHIEYFGQKTRDAMKKVLNLLLEDEQEIVRYDHDVLEYKARLFTDDALLRDDKKMEYYFKNFHERIRDSDKSGRA